MTGVRLKNVSKSYGAVEVITDMTLDIRAGELFFLLGPSGCGKTTLLRLIAGFIQPSAGTIFFDEKDITDVPPNRRNTGMVFQNYALWPHMTVAENIAFGLDVRRLPRDEKKTRIAEALELVHMPGYENRYPHQLSGGQQQRVALARALVIRPDVVLLDEPLSNLDAGLRIEMRKEIHRIHEELDVTMIYVTHDQKEALSLATRMGVLHDGVLAQTGSPTEIYQNPDSAFVAKFVGETNLLDGTVERVTDEEIEVATRAGAVVCPCDRAAKQFRAGDSATVSIRPEGLGFATPADEARNVWHATVVETTYLGEVVQVVCAVEEVMLRLTVLNPAGLPPRPGARRAITVNPAHVRILPGAPGVRH